MASVGELEIVKRRIGLTDDLQDDQLQIIIYNTKAELISLCPIGVDEVPARLNWIVIEVATKRYNRIGSEGMNSMSVDGLSNSFSERDFDQYMESIDNLFPKVSKTQKGRGLFF